MSRSSDTDRALVEPTAALAATFAVCVAVTLYAGVLGEAVHSTDRDLGEPTLTRVHDATSDRGVVDVDRIGRSSEAAPRGYRLNVSLRADGERWHLGPQPPREERVDLDRADRVVSVRRGPGDVATGRLAVVVWP